MYHSIIAARVRELFKRLGLQDYMRVLDGLAVQREHRFLWRPRAWRHA